jgi:cyclophilin family peptidyl-prolyl cis-trans isomerase
MTRYTDSSRSPDHGDLFTFLPWSVSNSRFIFFEESLMLQRSTLTLLTLLCMALASTCQTTPQTTPKTAPTKAGSTQKTGATGKSAAPAATATPGEHPTATIHTTAGDMKCELFPDKAPKATANFIGLATGKKDWTDPATGKTVHHRPLYDNVIFHRVIPGFMIQGGDPLGQGTGGPGYKFEDELAPDLLFDKPGRLAMANSGPNTNGSQFFITEQATPFLNPCFDEGGCMGGRRPKGSGYTIFGQCDDNTVQLVKKITAGPCQGGGACSGGNSMPQNPVHIQHIDISGVAAVKPAAKPGTRKKATKAGTKASAPK